MKPSDLPLAQTYAFVASRLMTLGASRILEVGCGDGRLALHLAATGLDVTALDLELPAARPAGVTWVERDFLAHEAEPYDALVFTSSLHHLSPLADALDRAKRLLRNGGVLLAEEFDLAAPDEKTATWFYGIQQLLAMQGVYPQDAIHGKSGDPPLERWRQEHDHDPPLQGGATMRAEIARRFPEPRVGTGPYLYRYMCANLPATPNAGRFASRLFETEKQRIAEGTMKPVGLRLVARK